jgi:hypothetical protein
MKKEKFKPLAKTVQELFSKRGRWCQDDDALDKANVGVTVKSSSAVKFCMMGAIGHVYNTEKKAREATKKLALVLGIKDYIDTEYDIAVWNDTISRTIKEVRQVVKKAGI